MTTRKKKVSPTVKSYDYNAQAQVVHEAARAAGLDVEKIVRHNTHASIQHGYSFVSFGISGITARREGEGKMGTYPIEISYEGPTWIRQCVDILAAGRTIECGSGVGLLQIRDYVHFSTVDHPLSHLAHVARRYDPWDLSPDYQRDHVWSTKQREQFMGHLLENGRMPLIFLQDGGESVPYQVIDGKQRLTSCLMFTDGEIAAELADGRRL